MEVRIKPRCKYFIYNQMRHEGEEVTLVPVEHSLTKEIITPEMQFSENNMEKIEAKEEPEVPVKKVTKKKTVKKAS